MNLARFLEEERVDMDLHRAFDDEEHPADPITLTRHMSALLETSSDIVNPSKLRVDIENRERRAPSMLGEGVYLPHVRTMQARKLVMAVGLARDGLPLDTPDALPVRLVIALVSPPYDDRVYHQVYKRLGRHLLTPDWVDRVVASEMPGEVLRHLSH